MELEVYRHRNGLPRTIKAINGGSLRIGFIGGSITEAKGRNRWPEYVVSWFMDKFPGVRIYVENAAIGATGSDLAVFRAERDLLSRNCDIVFLEFAVNDSGFSMELRMRSREGLIRKLLAHEERDLVITYTFHQPMYEEMINGVIPPSVSEFEDLAEHYGIGSVWMGLYALREVKNGGMRWEEWLPDGLHPENRGSLSYAMSVINYLEKEVISNPKHTCIPCCKKLPQPLNSMNWEKTHRIPFEDVKLEGPWTIRRCTELAWMDQILDTAAVGAKLSFEFKGRGLSIGFDFGYNSSEFRYKLDDSPWIEVYRERPYWCGDNGWYRISNIADGLEATLHTFQLEVTHGNKEGCRGTNFRLAFIGVIE